MAPTTNAQALLVLLLSYLSFTSAFNYTSYIGKTSTAGNVVPNRYIVEFNSSASMSAIAKRDGGIHNHVYRQLEERGVSYTVEHSYNSGVFVGASLTFANSTALAQVASMSGVVTFLPVRYVARPAAYQSTYDFTANGSGDYSEFATANVAKRDTVVTEGKRDALARGENPIRARGDKTSTTSTSASTSKASSSGSVVTSSMSSSKTASSSKAASVSSVLSSSSASSVKSSGSSSKASSASSAKSSSTLATSAKASATSSCAVIPAPTAVNYTANPMAGVDKLHAAGYFGAGVKVGVIDSGVDYTHPALGGCFGAGCKIAGGYDYVGDDFDGSNTPVPDDDPLDQCYGHGTFVAGVLGASLPNKYNITGPASSASQYHYRVFSCGGATTNDIVAQAMQDAYTAGMQVITLSLGLDSGWTESTLAVIASRIADAGVAITIAGGDSGQNGAFYTQSPASGASAMAVGSVDNYIYPAQNATVNTTCSQITYYSYAPIGTAGPYPIVTFDTVYPNNEDSCPPPASVANMNLTGKVVLLQRSTDTASCSQLAQVKQAYVAGARIVLVSNLDGMAPLYPGSYPLGYAYISQADGKMLFDQVQAGKNPAITFPFNPVNVPNNFTGGRASVFTALGPTWDLYQKPQFMGPGMYIVSTVPVEGGSYAIASGTSFSTPFLAGIAATYVGAHSNAKAATVLQALQGYSNPITNSVSDSNLLTVAMGGAGLTQAYEAVTSNTLVSPSQLNLNDTTYFNGTQYITVTNTGNSKIKYSVSHLQASTGYNFNTSTYESNYSPLPITDVGATVSFSPNSLNLKAGASGTIRVTFKAPTSLAAQRFPIYSGFIAVSGGANTVTVPYLGVAASMRSLPLLDNTATYTGTKLPQIVNGDSDVQTSSETYTLVDDDAPTLMYRIFGGSQVTLVDLVSSSASLGFSPTATKRDLVERASDKKSEIKSILSSLWAYLQSKLNGGSGHSSGGTGTVTNTFAQVPTLGNLYEVDYDSRNTGLDAPYDDGEGIYSYGFTGTFTNGTTVPNGNYKFLLRVLRITGNPIVEADYDSWLSPEIVINA